mmetsp:Transcript_1961/g.2809  ORF Transcript_1961/g.2809 Transcript_1961/m.2809 type:complete len:266 (+) Transcript_1961:407-1204(+)
MSSPADGCGAQFEWSQTVTAARELETLLASSKRSTLTSSTSQYWLVVNTLMFYGYKEAYEELLTSWTLLRGKQFHEKQVKLMDDKFVLGFRNQLRETIFKGKISDAISLLSSYDAALLSKNVTVHFRLRQQALIELIRNEEVSQAILYAQEYLSPLVEEQEELRQELEEVMSLLVFGKDQDSPVHHLFGSNQRRKTAFELNALILEKSCNIKKMSDLDYVLRLMLWHQKSLKCMLSQTESQSLPNKYPEIFVEELTKQWTPEKGV